MDYREEQFLRMQQSDTPKVPFYMSYPMQNLYLTEMEYEKDMDRMKELLVSMFLKPMVSDGIWNIII